MHKQASTFSKADKEDFLFSSLLKDAEKLSKGSLSNVKAHLSKIVSNQY